MRKIVYLFFTVLLASNISVGQQRLSIKLDYTKLQEVAAQLGTKNSLALYAVKENGTTTLKYAIYDPSTYEVSYFDGRPVSNAEFMSVFNSLVLDMTVLFKSKAKKGKLIKKYGFTGLKQDETGKNFIINGLKIINQHNSVRNQAIYEIFVRKMDSGKIRTRFIDSNGNLLKDQGGVVGGGGGGGPGGDGTVAPAPPK